MKPCLAKKEVLVLSRTRRLFYAWASALVLTGSSTVLATGSVAGASAPVLSVSTPHIPSLTSPIPMPPLPSPGASVATWQAWAAQEARSLRSADWSEYASERGCTLLNIQFPALDAAQAPGLASSYPGIPANVPVAGASGIMRCGAPKPDGTLSTSEVSPSVL